MSNRRILIVEDEKLLRMSLMAELSTHGYRVAEAETGKAGIDRFAKGDVDLVLLDYRLPDTDGLDVLQTLMGERAEVPVILMTAYSSIETAVKAIKLGAYDYVNKPFDIDELLIRIEKALETRELKRDVSRLTRTQRDAHGLGRILGESAAIQGLRMQVERIIASRTATVLIRGESGTGKDLVARAIHYESDRARAPLVNVTCTAIPDHLLESELFGHEKGAFTDARNQKIGLFEQAHGGTVFLDEIGDMSVALQAKILRVLEDRTFRRVGGTKDLTVDVRIVAATNRDLEAAVQGGCFRSDLYYRLKVIELFVPPLRDRAGDARLLASALCQRFAKELRRPLQGVTEEALQQIERYAWPGNVRELKNAIERAVILGLGDRITLADLPPELGGRGPSSPPALQVSPSGERRPCPAPAAAAAPAPAAAAAPEAPQAESRSPEERGWLYFELPQEGLRWQELEDDLVRQALERTGSNQSSAARLLSLSRDQLRYRMERMGLLPPSKQRLRRIAKKGKRRTASKG